MIDIKFGERCALAVFESEGFRRTKLVSKQEDGDLGTFSHEKGNNIYVLRELNNEDVIPVRYVNLETGEVRS